MIKTNMKLLKYVMTSDSGLAPNPFFGMCSLALCTPNHMNATLCVGDWVLGHSTRKEGNKLIYAMQVTKILDMPSYFLAYPEKRPIPTGNRIEQCGDNLYTTLGGNWVRLPSACHNNAKSFRKDQDCPVFLAEGEDNFWYFGGSNFPFIEEFGDKFPRFIKDRQGFSYVRDQQSIGEFTQWLHSLGRKGRIGEPRDSLSVRPSKYLVAIDPEEQWIANEKIDRQPQDCLAPVTVRTRRRECL